MFATGPVAAKLFRGPATPQPRKSFTATNGKLDAAALDYRVCWKVEAHYFSSLFNASANGLRPNPPPLPLLRGAVLLRGSFAAGRG